MKFFPYKKKNLGKTELQFIIGVMIESCASAIDCIYEDKRMGINLANEDGLVRIALESLGWNGCW
jgi:hypothetical protein